MKVYKIAKLRIEITHDRGHYKQIFCCIGHKMVSMAIFSTRCSYSHPVTYKLTTNLVLRKLKYKGNLVIQLPNPFRKEQFFKDI